MSDSPRFFGSAKLIAACTLLSRVTGLARDIILNAAFGQNWIQDAFNYGFQIPNLFRRLFGEGALAAVFVPTFTEVLDRDGRPAAWTLLGRVTGLLALVLASLTAILEIVVLIVWLSSPAQPMRQLMLGLTALMLPFMISICLLALFSSILNCLNHFAVPALAPIVLNICNILGVLVVGPAMSIRPEIRIYGVAASVLAASVLQIFIVLPVLRARGVIIRPSLSITDPHTRAMMRSLAPILIGQGVLLLNVFLDSQVCTFLTRGPNQPETFHVFNIEARYPLHSGALSAVTNAARLYQFPLGVLAISLATAAFPLLSRYAARGDYANLRNAFGQSFRLAVFEGLPSGLIMIVLAQPIVSLLFEYGRFGPEATVRAASVLRWYGVGMWAFCAQHVILRGFYSVKDTLTPMWIGCGLVLLNQAINISLIWHPAIAESAFGIGTSATAMLHVIISMFILRRRMGGRLGARRLALAFVRTALAGGIATGVAYGLVHWGPHADWADGSRLIRRALDVFLPMGGAIVAYLMVAWVLRLEEVGWVVGRQQDAI